MIVIGDKPYRASNSNYDSKSVMYDARVCVGCCRGVINWDEFYEVCKAIPLRYVERAASAYLRVICQSII